MSTTTAKLNIDASQALAALNRVDKQIQGLGKSFGALQKVIGGIAIGAFIRNAFTLADAIDDISKATGIAIENVMGFGRAVQANGGTIEDANNALFKLTQNIGEAAAGSASAQQSFREVGVSLQDLATLSEQEILEKVIKGLGEIPDKAEQARLSVELMGKGFKGLDLSNLGKDYQQAVIDSAKYAQATKSAADANQNLQAILGKLANELLLVLQPISDMVKKIDANSESFMRWFNAIKTVAGVLFTIFGIVVPLARAFLALRAGAAVAATAIKELGSKDFPRFLSDVKGWITNLPKVFTIVKEGIAKAETGIKTATNATDAAKYATRLKYWEQIAEKLTTVKQIAMGAATGIATVGAAIFGYATGGPSKEEEEAKKRLEKYKKDREALGAGPGPQGPRRMGAQQREVIDALAKQGDEIRNITAAYKDNNDQIIANINSEARYLGMSEKNVEIAKFQTEIYDKAISQIKDLQQKKALLTDKEKLLGPIIDEQIEKIEKSIIVDQIRGTNAIKNLQAQREAIEAVNKAIDLQITKRQNLESIKNLEDEIKMLGMTDKERQQFLRTKEAEKTFNNEINAILDEQARKGKNATETDILNWKRRKLEATNYYNEILLKNEQLAEAEGNSANKLQRYLKQREEDLQDSLDPANRLIDLSKRFEQEIDNFTETGKFKFKEMLLNWVRDWAAAEAKMAATQLFKQILGKAMGGIGGFIGKLFGFAEGGSPPVNKPSIVGEKGPELFVPKQAGTVVPNDKLGKGMGQTPTVVNNYTYNNNISAVDAKSVATLFYENRKSLLGATAAAQKELPYGMRG